MSLREREVRPELLDDLPALDPLAVGSRRDLRRLNAQMRSAELMAAALAPTLEHNPPRTVIELGAGDGTLLLDVATRLQPRWPLAKVILLDRQELLDRETAQGYQRIGWNVHPRKLDLFDWLREPEPPCDLILANLFLHHFGDNQLAEILPAIATRTRAFLALEPRRSPRFLLVTKVLWLYGCNRVTRYDAQVSVRAGFKGHELGRHWPADSSWKIHEGKAGWFSHMFHAVQTCDSKDANAGVSS